MNLMLRIVSGLIGGVVLAFLGAMLIGLTSGGGESGGSAGAVAFLVFFIIGMAIAITAPRPGKSWRRIMITAGIMAFMLPLASMIFAGAAVNEISEQTGNAAAVTGAAIGGSFVTVASGIVGFFLGLIFLVIGLLSGRDQNVVVVNTAG